MTLLRRIGTQLLLWAAPLGVVLAIALVLSQSRWFQGGPGVPTAGDERAWDAIWGAFGLVAAGCVVGGVASLAWIWRYWRSGERRSALEWFRTALNLAMAVGFYWLVTRN